jgi:hypothetical protein
MNRRRRSSEGRGQIHCAPRKARARLKLVQGKTKVVARDGIEPPTPAFSGPRSTTELPGLSEDFQLQFLRGIRHCRKKVGWSTFSALQRLTQYINSHSGKPIGPA